MFPAVNLLILFLFFSYDERLSVRRDRSSFQLGVILPSRAQKNNKKNLWLKLSVFKERVMSAREIAQDGAKDEHTVYEKCAHKMQINMTHTSKGSHFPESCHLGKFSWFFCVNLHSCGFYRVAKKKSELRCGAEEMRQHRRNANLSVQAHPFTHLHMGPVCVRVCTTLYS